MCHRHWHRFVHVFYSSGRNALLLYPPMNRNSCMINACVTGIAVNFLLQARQAVEAFTICTLSTNFYFSNEPNIISLAIV